MPAVVLLALFFYCILIFDNLFFYTEKITVCRYLLLTYRPIFTPFETQQ